MKRVIEVVEFDPGSGNEWAANLYPGPGIYTMARNAGTVYMIGANCVTTLCNAYDLIAKFKDVEDAPVVEQEPSAPSGFTPSDIIKLVAVTTQPELAKDLL